MSYVALAVREYGQGRICIHTDRIGAIQTGHGQNPIYFWRKLIGWTALKNKRELIKIGLINNVSNGIPVKLHDIKPVQINQVNWSDFNSIDLSSFDLLYIIGLEKGLSSQIPNQISSFIEHGGGLIIEYPNVKGSINVLSDIEDVDCYSKQRPTLKLAYWTLNGVDSKLYTDNIDMAFMSTMEDSAFSSEWTLLMTDVKTTVNTTTTLASREEGSNITGSSSSEFGISYISSMQNGIVELKSNK